MLDYRFKNVIFFKSQKKCKKHNFENVISCYGIKKRQYWRDLSCKQKPDKFPINNPECTDIVNKLIKSLDLLQIIIENKIE